MRRIKKLWHLFCNDGIIHLPWVAVLVLVGVVLIHTVKQ